MTPDVVNDVKIMAYHLYVNEYQVVVISKIPWRKVGHVDDILIAGLDPRMIAQIKSEFTSRYEMKDLGELNYYLGMKVTRTADYI